MSEERGREPQRISTGRGGAGNLVRSLSRGPDSEQIPTAERGREVRSPSHERVSRHCVGVVCPPPPAASFDATHSTHFPPADDPSRPRTPAAVARATSARPLATPSATASRRRRRTRSRTSLSPSAVAARPTSRSRAAAAARATSPTRARARARLCAASVPRAPVSARRASRARPPLASAPRAVADTATSPRRTARPWTPWRSPRTARTRPTSRRSLTSTRPRCRE